MPGLWADGWFYISSAGLLVSGALFFFLLGQYRAAADAHDEAHADEPLQSPATLPVRPVYVHDEEDAKTAPLPAAEPAPAPAPSKDAFAASATGGISPAVTYLQNLKSQLDEMGGELRGLGKKVAAVSERDEALIERLAELTRAVEELKGLVAEPPTPRRRKTDKAPASVEPITTVSLASSPSAEPEPAAPSPAPEPVTPVAAPMPEPVAELKIELGAAPGTGAAVETPAAAPNPDATFRADELKAALEPQGAAPEEEKPRRGPVWPV